MEEIKTRIKEINRSLKTLNRKANKFIKPYRINRNAWKLGYGYLTKSDIWSKAKRLLFENKTLQSHHLECLVCNQLVYQNRNVLHHTKYNRRRFFKPSYVTFVHYFCHERIHSIQGRPLLSRYMNKKFCMISIYFIVIALSLILILLLK